jgi:hypothetical protein
LNLIRALIAFVAAGPVWAQYVGPAILSRGEAPAGIRSAQISFRPFVELTGIYDTGLSGVGVVDPQGNLASQSGVGVQLSGGVSGSHRWRHTTLGLTYKGDFRHYTKRTYYDGTDQAINLGITHQVSRHFAISLRESAGIISRDFGLLGLQQAIPFDPGASYVPTTDYFDNRTLHLSTQADFTYQRSARLSFNGGGDFFTAKRRSKALYGITGETARGDVQYRVGRYTTIGVNYLYSRFAFGRGFGDTNLHTGSASFSQRLTKTVEISFYGGVSVVETKFIQVVPIDPVIAAIIGQGAGLAIIHRIDHVPNVGGRLSRTFRNSIASISGSRATTPGNGLFLTSVMTSVSAEYRYTGFRRWSAGVSAGYSSGDVISNVTGAYRSYSGSLDVARRLGHGLNAVARFDARQYDSGNFARYNRLIYRGSIGFAYTPGDLPLRIW